MVARERRIGRMGNEGMTQTDHEGPRMLPDQSNDLIDKQACQTGSGGFK